MAATHSACRYSTSAGVYIPLLHIHGRSFGMYGRREEKEMAAVLDSSFRITAIIALPCALGMAAIPRYILSSLFTQTSAERMAPLLSVLAIAVFFIGLLATTNCALQAAGKERLPIISMLAGAAIKLAASWILIGIPAVGIYGTPISTVLCYAVAAGLNLILWQSG